MTENGSVFNVTKLRGLRQWLLGKGRDRAPDLGPRELDVLGRLWQSEPLTAAEIAQRIGVNTVALSTVQSTLERLHRKGMVVREKRGRAFTYFASLTRSQLISLMLRDLANDFGDGDPAPLFSGFVDFAAGQDSAVRRELQRMLRSATDAEPDDD